MPGPRVLVVDDQEPILFAIRDYLTSQGFEVDTVTDAPGAKGLLSQSFYAAVVADLRLSGTGGMEGLDILRFVKERSPTTAAVLLTAYRSPTVDYEARQCRADAVLGKPTPLAALAGLLSELIEGRSPESV